MKTVARLALVLFTVAVLQRGLFSQLRIADVSVDVFLLLALVGGMTAGPERGAIIGFFSGLTLDLLVQTPLGLSALVYCLAGFAAGRLQGTVLRANRFLPRLLVAALSAATVAAYAVVAEVLGQNNALSPDLPVIMLVVAVANALLYPLARRVVSWSWPQEHALRPALR
jgi:rod shape-determining protein MreD